MKVVISVILVWTVASFVSAFAIRKIRTGKTRFGMIYADRDVLKEEHPIFFWFDTIFNILFAAACVYFAMGYTAASLGFRAPGWEGEVAGVHSPPRPELH